MGYRYRRKGNKERKKERRGRGEGTKGKKQTNKQNKKTYHTAQDDSLHHFRQTACPPFLVKSALSSVSRWTH